MSAVHGGVGFTCARDWHVGELGPTMVLPSAHFGGAKKEPQPCWLGLQSLNAVNTVRHLLREEKQGMNALRRIIHL